MKKILYFSRFNDLNLASNKKSIKFIEIFNKAKFETIKFGISKDFFINSYKSEGGNYFQYFLKYLIEIVKLSISSLIIFRKDTSISTICFVDILPDTHFPVFLILIYSKLWNRKIKIIADIEENIEVDNVNILFKIYSFISKRIFIPDIVFLINPKINIYKASKNKIITPGLVSEKDIEEIKRNIINQNPNMNILFSSRIDNQRGIYKFLDLLFSLKKSDLEKIKSKFRKIYLTGYGSISEILKFKNYLNSNSKKYDDLKSLLKVEIMSSEERYKEIFFGSDINISYVENQSFLNNSFPSKVFEALLNKKIIINYGKLPMFENYKNIINIESLNRNEFFKVLNFIYSQKKTLNSYSCENSNYLIENYSTYKISKKLEKMIF